MLDVADHGDVLADVGLFVKTNVLFVELAINVEPLTEAVVVETIFTSVAVVVVVVVVVVAVVVVGDGVIVVVVVVVVLVVLVVVVVGLAVQIQKAQFFAP